MVRRSSSGARGGPGAAADGDALAFDGPFRARLGALLTWRRDVRAFRREPLPAGTLERLLALACLAPSVGLSEPWRFVVVEDAGLRAAIRRNFEHCNAAALAAQARARAGRYAKLKLDGLAQAPCQLAVFADRATAQGHGLGRHTLAETIDYSAVAAVHTLWLAARAEGIGMGWVSILDAQTVSALLEVPPAWKFIGYFCLGYAEADDAVPALQRVGWERRQKPASFIFRR